MASVIYEPIHRKQIGDPTTNLDSFICTLESAAMALDAQTHGRVQVWGGQLVPFCGRSPSLIQKMGTNLHNAASAWDHWGQDLVIKTGGNWGDVLAARAENRYVILQGDYDQFSLATRCQKSFTNDHAVLMSPKHTSSTNRTADPLCNGWKEFPTAELRRYSEKLGKRLYGAEWDGQLFFAVTRPMIEVPDTSEDDMPELNYGAERWMLDGKQPVTSVGAPRLADGTSDPNVRYVLFSGKAGAQPWTIQPVPRSRLTAITRGLSDDFWLALTGYRME